MMSCKLWFPRSGKPPEKAAADEEKRRRKTMLIPSEIRTYNTLCGLVPNVRCRHCGQTGTFHKVKNKSTGLVLFVPIITKTNSAYLVCDTCGKVYPVPKKGFDRITSAADVNEVITAQENAQRQEREHYQAAGFSPKNQTLAVILAITMTTLGAPFFYIGKPLWGILFLLLSLASSYLRLFAISALIVCFGFGFAYRLGTGKVKDKKGRYIVSKRQKEALEQNSTGPRM